MKRTLALVIAAVIMLGLFAGCGSSPSNSPAPPASSSTPSETTPAKSLDQKTVRVGIAYDPNNLEPWAALNNGRIDVLRCVYEFLFDREGTGGKLIPCIGSSYEQVDDYTYNVHIYDNVYDSKGNHITADDIVFDFQTAIELGNLVVGLGNLTEVKKLDTYSVQFVFNSKAAGVFENAITNVYIVSKAAYEADPNRMSSNPVGTGAYVVENFIPGSSVTFVKRNDYWQSDDKRAPLSQANIGRIVYKVIPEKSQMTIALQNHDVDLAYYVQSTDISHFEEGGDSKGFSVLAKPADLAQVIFFNCDSSSVFSNVALRQCVAYAINNAVILQNVYGNQGGLCKTFGTPVFADYMEKWNKEDYYDYNVEKAKEKLAEAGYSAGQLNIKLMTDNGTEHQKMAQIIQAMLGQIGINVQILVYDQTLYSTYRFDPAQWDIRIDNKSSFDYITSVWKFSFDASMYNGATVNFYSDDKLQTLLTTSMDAKTHTPENIDACHQYLKDICIGYGICYGVNYYVYVDTIKNVALDFKNCVPAGACEYSDAFIGG